MEQQQQTQPPPPSTTTAEPPPQQQPSPSPTTTTTTATSSTTQLPPTPTPTPLAPPPNPTPAPTTATSSPTLQPRPSPYNRPWQQQQQQPSPFQHFSLPAPPIPPPPSQQNPRVAMGVPAHHHTYPHQFTRNNPPDSGPTSSASQGRQPVQGIHGASMMGTLGSTSPMRPAGVPLPQQRPVPSSLRPQTNTSSQSVVTQNFQGHGMLRAQSLGFPSSQSHPTSQNPRSQNQPWLSSGAQGKPPLHTLLLRPQIGHQSLPQRSHLLLQQQQSSSAQQSQPSTSSQSQDHLGQQMPPARIQQSLSNQPVAKAQRPPSHALMPPSSVQPGPHSKATAMEVEKPSGKILSKRSIQEIVTQIDPSEKLDAEVEDILVDLAEEFVESITTFGCSLAKHRKSSTLEAKDILLHLERNWNITLPGFGGDEIRAYKKPFARDIHKERISAIKRSVLASEMTSAKGSTQASGNVKSHMTKGPCGGEL